MDAPPSPAPSNLSLSRSSSFSISGASGNKRRRHSDRFTPERGISTPDVSFYGSDKNEDPLRLVLSRSLSVNVDNVRMFNYGSLSSPSSSQSNFDEPTSKEYQPSTQFSRSKDDKSLRRLPQKCYKCLDAPDLLTDFHLNLLDWSKDDKTLAVALANRVFLWSDIGVTVKLCEFPPEELVTCVRWTSQRSSTQLSVCTTNGGTYIYDSATCERVRSYQPRTSSKTVFSMSWNGPILSTGLKDKKIVHRDVRDQRNHVSEVKVHRSTVCGLNWNCEGILASGSDDGELMIWTDLQRLPIHRIKGHTSALKAMTWNPFRPSSLITGGGTLDETIKFWNVTSGTMISSHPSGGQVCNLLWSSSTNEIISTHGTGLKKPNSICVWTTNMKEVGTIPGHVGRVTQATMTTDGRTLVTAGCEEKLFLWDISTSSSSRNIKRKREIDTIGVEDIIR